LVHGKGRSTEHDSQVDLDIVDLAVQSHANTPYIWR
jgi:hypothetical protein